MTQLVCVLPNGERIEVVVAVGHPYRTSDEDWICPVEISGLDESVADVHGIDSFQALRLAVRLVGERLAAILGDGGRIVHPSTGESITLESYLGAGGTESSPGA